MNVSNLFNVNGSIGCGAYAVPDFPDADAYIKHLDYLGINRSLVWHIEARDLNPAIGNQRLLKNIADAGLTERLLPAFVITPACYFECGVIEFLRESFASGQVKALRIMPEISCFPVRQIERVLAELAEFRPLLLWDCRTFTGENDFRGLEYLAQKFPQVNFALTQKMWPGFNSVLDAMWRCPNIYVDTSWLHMRNTIELLRDEFGAERILFGIGHKAHNGAAIAMLMHARISGAERELIAHSNSERLLGLSPLTGKFLPEPAILEQKPWWRKFRSGQALKEVKIIDAHSHDGPHTRSWILRKSGPDVLLEQMDRLGVDKLLLSSERALFGDGLEGNCATEQVFASYGDRFKGYFAFNPRFGDKLTPKFDEFFGRDFYIGFKLLASFWKIPLIDPAYKPVWEYADKHRLPILLHTWNDEYNSPAMLTEIAEKYSNAIFLLGHSGGGTSGRLEAEKLVLDNNNVYLEFCGTFTTPIPFEQSADKVGWNKVLFGSDTGAHCEAWELGRYLSMPVPDKILEPGLAENMEKILAKKI
ncbi:MAG: amidohydrolase family protein [Victivallales bacterium]|nr:amidohydrolase family protein [Victivallales bacterium]